MARTFFAIPIAHQKLEKISVQLERVKAEFRTQVHWTRAENWHVTIRFLGEVSHKQLAVMIEEARRLAREVAPGGMHIKKLANFPRAESTVVALHIHSNLILNSLVTQLDEAAMRVGIAKDKRRFRPHITLGKFNSEAAPLTPVKFEHFDIPFAEFVLYESKIQGETNHYRELHRFKLQNED